ncbi:MAG: nitrilase-related carbon-nitrogen hydrolase [Planctomycetota bacterium]|nr:nitrilase-related carbon-nitrogen hydrolase [Planctomycetota bacterium]
MKAPLTVTLVQCDATLGDIEKNAQAHLEVIAATKEEETDLIVFPELSLTGYVLRDLTPEVAMKRNHPVLKALCEASLSVDLVVGYIEEGEDSQLRNAVAYFSSGSITHVHHKVYLPTYSMFEEARYWGAGDVVAAFDTRYGRLGILTCEDVWHPSTSYCLFADRADVIIVPSASPARGITVGETPSQDLQAGSSQAWRDLLRQQSSAFNVYSIYVNRCGVEDGTSFAGGSCVIDPYGSQLLDFGMEAKIQTITLDPESLRRRRQAVPMLRDERLDVTLGNLTRVARERFDD